MYQKYHTEALVLGNRERGENDRVFTLYTEEFGLVRARASAVRTEASRMRYALQNYSRARVALVRGKRGWRIGGAIPARNAGGSAATFARVARLVARLVAGEERNQYLFAVLAEAHAALMNEERGAPATIELVCVARVLHALGYLSAEALGGALFTHTAYAGEHLLEAETMRDKLLLSINKAIAETHL
ncbi:hypothetical protein A3C21_02295 [Candidatus Kaiserbacteria bacterium RIFCSPHIGHO2_02_FULL_59_21]|uniref:DNA replication/recombination mediator RecO N-terminal domain-containing protein n=2 Tax=Candidatus Kaiseribacteriota TaxID=1752734 RepID=A0A1F6E098_9BACT|nr:MAG: hypothetical protein A2766_04105 [Candidatus Kaiserbacteria bacterium RIFCSPHIGHO2_01_FULL_58_22]OGG67066.1 MAG: hypothetical protein A3C21_02295 [Candidatus Kaiserbacteria bacterium RIFCSPHIGHO2_02_FULL_59_21]OGG86830.1 MAG: hypothetical protein A3I47_04155 [Candidatus Kaiserbacteria bacterium RIFCSPLOWO2_02_FULL_59_19]